MEGNKILIPGILSRYSPRADKSWSVTLNINEPSPEQKVVIDRMHQSAVFVLLKDAGITKDEESILDNVDVDLDNSKTPSQRLRGTLYRNWEQDNKGYTEFKEYYKAMMEKIIQFYKNKLD
jgi:uncharacterized protein YeaO (DUF488 family)